MESAPLMLSVSGARGIVGASMTSEVAARLCVGFVEVLQAHGRASPRLLLARDGRASGKALADACAAALGRMGCTAVDLGVVATPTAGFMVLHSQADGAVVITASHNPIQWNGIKFIDSTGAAPDALLAGKILERFHLAKPASGKRSATDEPVASGKRSATDEPTAAREIDADQLHADRVVSLVDREAIAAARLHVALDSCNGGGARSGRLLLEMLGVTVTQINGEQTGAFARTPEPIRENLGQLCQTVSATGAAMGFAQDPDADRLAIVDERGLYIGEEYTLAICAKRILQRMGSVNLATNLSTSRMIDDLARGFPNTAVFRSAVGEANVVAQMRAHGCALGGEGNGGVIWPQVCHIRDSIGSMALVLESVALGRKSISDLVASLPRYVMVKRKLDLSQIGGAAAVPSVLALVRERFAGELVDTRDGVRVDLATGWVHLRASNTEPIIRLIGEAASLEAANQLCDQCSQAAGLSP